MHHACSYMEFRNPNRHVYYKRGNQHLYQDSGGFQLNKMTRKLGTMSAKNSSRDWWRKICGGPVTWHVAATHCIFEICTIDLLGYLAVMYCKKKVHLTCLPTSSKNWIWFYCSEFSNRINITPWVQICFSTTILWFDLPYHPYNQRIFSGLAQSSLYILYVPWSYCIIPRMAPGLCEHACTFVFISRITALHLHSRNPFQNSSQFMQ